MPSDCQGDRNGTFPPRERITFIEANYGEQSHIDFLYAMLRERYAQALVINIEGESLPECPSVNDYRAWLVSKPYELHYLAVEAGGTEPVFVAHGLLKGDNEIGVFVKRQFQGTGIGTRCVEFLMGVAQRPFYTARINPANSASLALFERLDFRPTCVTLRRAVTEL